MARASWVGMREVVDRLAPLVPKTQYLVPERLERNYRFGFSGGESTRLAVTIYGPGKGDETHLDVTRPTGDECIEALEELLK